MQSCSTEDLVLEQQSNIETVSKTEAVSFVKGLHYLQSSTAKSSALENDFDFDKITQEKLTNTSELLTVIPIKTKIKNQRRRALFLRVGTNIESMIYHEFAEASSTQNSFDGIVLMTWLNGDFIRAYRLKNNKYVIELVPNNKTKSSQKATQLTSRTIDGGELNEVVISNNFKNPTTYVSLNEMGAEVPITISWDALGSGGTSGDDGSNEAEPAVVPDPCLIAKDVTQDALEFTFLSATSNIQIASSDGLEHSITLGRDASGITQSPIRTGGQNAVAVNTSWPGAFASLHNHPNKTHLSAGDIYSIIKLNTMNSNFNTSYILTNGQLYAIIVNDLKAASLCYCLSCGSIIRF